MPNKSTLLMNWFSHIPMQRRIWLPVLLVVSIFMLGGAIILTGVEGALQSYQDVQLSLSSHILKKKFEEMVASDQNQLKLLVVQPEIWEGLFVARNEDNTNTLGKPLLRGMESANAHDIWAIHASDRVLFHAHPNMWDPRPNLGKSITDILSKKSIHNAQKEMDQAMNSILVPHETGISLITVGPLLDVEDIVGVVILVRHLEVAFVTALRDQLKLETGNNNEIQVLLTIPNQESVASLEGLVLPTPSPDPGLAFNLPVHKRMYRHLLTPVSQGQGALLLSVDASNNIHLQTLIRWILILVFLTVLILVLTIVLFNAKRISLEEHARQLKESETRFRRLTEAAMEGIAFSEQGILRDVNPAMCDMFGYPMEEWLNRPITQLFLEQDHQEIITYCSLGSQERHELHGVRKNGDVFDIAIRTRTMHYSGREMKVIAIQDITESKLAEQQLIEAKKRAEQAYETLKATQSQLVQAEKFASLGQLVAGVAHEINTPVGIGVTVASHLAEETRNIQELFQQGTIRKGDFRDYIDTASNASQLLLANMNRAADLMRSFKQVSVDRTSEERRLFDTRQYINEILLSLHPKIKKSKIQVEVNGTEGIIADSYPGSFAQILTNLIINSLMHAFDAGQEGRIEIHVTQPDPITILMTFEDNGHGILPEHLPRIFDPFFTTNRGKGGSGLGLHISYNLANHSLGGGLTVQSVVGQGTVFWLRFPKTAHDQPVKSQGELLT